MCQTGQGILFADKPRLGAPKSKVLIANVRKQIEEDPNVSIREISSELDISLGTIHYVLHEEVGLRKISGRWVPHVLIPEQQKNRVDCVRQPFAMFQPVGPKCVSN